MIVGLLPSIRGGLRELAKSGQHTRFIESYLKPYARAFERVCYFSYFSESLDEYTHDVGLLAKVRILPGARWHPWLYSFWIPFRYWHDVRRCNVLRVFQVTGVIPALLAKTLFGIPFVTTYGFWYAKLARSRVRGWLRSRVAAAGLAAADGVIVTTPELRSYVAGRVGSSKVHLVPNGVDTTLFRPVPRSSAPEKTILYVGRLSEEKNLPTLIEATAKLVGRFGLRLMLIGEGPVRPALEIQARQLQIPVEFRPFVDHRALPAHFAEADAFVLPSFTEGHPKVLLEAMSCGIPCVASNVSGNRSILSDGQTGLLFDPRDANALADRLERVFGDDEFARRLGERARAEVLARYDLQVLVAREIALVKRVAGGG